MPWSETDMSKERVRFVMEWAAGSVALAERWCDARDRSSLASRPGHSHEPPPLEDHGEGARAGNLHARMEVHEPAAQLDGAPLRLLLAGGDDDVLHGLAGGRGRRPRSARALVERSKVMAALALATNPPMSAVAADAKPAAELADVDDPVGTRDIADGSIQGDR